MKDDWNTVKDNLIENVFYAHDAQAVADSKDLAADGLLDSLSIVAILEVLADCGADEEALDEAQATDFANLATIESLYSRV
ncbi:hypothetical protein [Gephyromycinifex aptenodytis]|uniref:hypothetical protein n=1 Tax=Gephyromycinifex aptenodytis TaxID=2716227 RepID=UPI001445FEED|nr:hypothetical protein [Gephyromycinifex aptenodytis]